MLIVGPSISDKVQIVTSAAADIESTIHWISVDTSTPPVVQDVDSSTLASITTATTTDALVGAASTKKRVGWWSLRNNHGSTSCDVTIRAVDGTNTVDIIKCTLLAGEALHFTGSTWIHYDTNGGMYPSVGNAASQAEMEAGTATDKYVTPQGANWHPGVAKAWAKHAVSGGVPQMTVTWNVTSVTDSAVCRVAPVIATDFSSANYVINYGFECNTTTYSATTTALIQTIRNATQAVGGFTIDLVEIDIGQTTDPAAWHWVAFGDQ